MIKPIDADVKPVSGWDGFPGHGPPSEGPRGMGVNWKTQEIIFKPLPWRMRLRDWIEDELKYRIVLAWKAITFQDLSDYWY